MGLFRWLERHLEEALCGIALSVIACSVFFQVVMRYAFGSAPHWTEEVAAFSMAWAVYMGAAFCVRERFHIRILVGAASLPGRLPIWVIFLADLCFAFFAAFMIKVGIEYLGVLWKYPSRTASLGINEFYPQSVIVIGYALILLRLVQLYVRWWMNGRQGYPSVRPEDMGLEPSEDAATEGHL